EPGPGRLITGTFAHRQGQVWELRLVGCAEVLGLTATHPVWSADRNGWVPAGELRVGERLLAADGSTPVVESFRLRPEPEPVYNLEVEGDHCFRVGRQGLLVHNNSVKKCGCFFYDEDMAGAKARGVQYPGPYAALEPDKKPEWLRVGGEFHPRQQRPLIF